MDATTLRNQIGSGNSAIGTGDSTTIGGLNSNSIFVLSVRPNGYILAMGMDDSGMTHYASWNTGNNPNWTSRPSVRDLGLIIDLSYGALASGTTPYTMIGYSENASLSKGCGRPAIYTIHYNGSSYLRATAVSTMDGITYYSSTWDNVVDPTWYGPPRSTTITHQTDVQDFDDSQIGTFCESTGELSTVYGPDFEPTLDRACDAIVKVKQSNALNSAILGIIVGPDTFASHGDCLCLVVEGDYEVGDLLVPHESGLCRRATEQEALWAMVHRVALPKITAMIPDREFVCCFIQ
jgi:hypothetical protein